MLQELLRSADCHDSCARVTSDVTPLKKFRRRRAVFAGLITPPNQLRDTCPRLQVQVAHSSITTTTAGWTSTWSTAGNAISTIPTRRCATRFTEIIGTARLRM